MCVYDDGYCQITDCCLPTTGVGANYELFMGTIFNAHVVICHSCRVKLQQASVYIIYISHIRHTIIIYMLAKIKIRASRYSELLVLMILLFTTERP